MAFPRVRANGISVGTFDAGLTDKMTNLATKPSSRDDGLVARLVILSNMLHKPDISAARSGTILCPRTRGTTPEVSRSRETTPHDTDYVSSLQYTQ